MGADVTGKTASVVVDAQRIEWWADAVGDRDSTLAQVGTEAVAHGRHGEAGRRRRRPQEAQPLTPTEPAQGGSVTKSSGGGMSGARIGAIGMMAGGAVVAGLGVMFGVFANQSRAKIDNAATNAQGQVTGITQREAYQLDSSVRTNATLANVMYGVGGALAAGGLIVFLVGGSSSSSSASLLPTGNGVMVSGAF